MGAGAFIMSQWTGISYLHIIAVAAIPAVMYFLTVGFFVHIEALKIEPKNHGQEEDIPTAERRAEIRKAPLSSFPVGLLIGLAGEGIHPHLRGLR